MLQNPYLAVMQSNFLLSVRTTGQWLTPIIFYILITVLFPLAIGANKSTLQLIAPGIIWVAVLLTTVISLEYWFRTDFQDGSLALLYLSPQPFVLLIMAKLLAQWVINSLPLILLTPLLGSLFSLSASSIGILMLVLLLGTPILNLVGAIGAALTVNVRNSGALLALIILPLYIPVLIFSAGAVNAAGVGLPIAGQIYFLIALLVLAITLGPIAIAAALKIHLAS